MKKKHAVEIPSSSFTALDPGGKDEDEEGDRQEALLVDCFESPKRGHSLGPNILRFGGFRVLGFAHVCPQTPARTTLTGFRVGRDV